MGKEADQYVSRDFIWRIFEFSANENEAFGNYQNPAYLAAATLENVILQFQKNDRLQVPLINVADGVNGVTLLNTTLFPATLSMGYRSLWESGSSYVQGKPCRWNSLGSKS